MVVLGVLLVSWLAFRATGAMGAAPLRSWRASGRWALAAMLFFTAYAHFGPMREDLARMVPEWAPSPMVLVYVTGLLEVAGAVGLLVRRTRRAAGIGLCVLFLAMFPANVKADREGLTVGGSRATPLAVRVPMQVLFVWLAWWSSRRGKSEVA
jgi:uncharacterized membrane protein